MSPQARSDRQLLRAVVALAVGLGIAARLLAVDFVPTWLYIGSVTLDTISLLTFVLGGVVAADWLQRRVAGGRDTTVGDGTGLLGVLTILASVFAQVSLNTSNGGVFFASVPALLLGSLLVAVVLARSGYRVVRGTHTDDLGA
ncbi:hypothetical protein ACFQJ5_09155 [Halomicroarcula sp. GCM10025324]|uniref:hypothetical protein n=1 Tax=Haloarcula TaxID=2237 RepID=UPI0023E8A030|nr:hypothetical protein [Halomicroarcula sp. ZS-22-S1]